MRLLSGIRLGTLVTQRCSINRSLSAVKMSTTAGKIGYATDIEGNFDYWNKYLSVSEVLYKESSNPRSIKLEDGCQFVYGGDVCDRGSGCFRVMEDLINLKELYPDRVHLILGNRDINKLRIQSSLHPSVLAKYPSVYWVKMPPQETVTKDYKLNDAEDKMKWILSKSMGAPISYETRREELLAMRKHATDAMVAPWVSFLQSTDPQAGLLTRYLELGQVAAVIENVLFVHGAVHEHNMGWVPPSLSDIENTPENPASPLAAGHFVGDLHEWVRQMNAFVASEIQDYRQRTPAFLDALSSPEGSKEGIWETKGGYHHPQPGSRLIQYGMGRLVDGTLNPSVIYSSYLQQIPKQVPTTVPAPLSELAADWLKRGGVDKVVVGHQPVGDAPLFMKAHGVEMISMDTSYSKNVQWPLAQLLALHPNTLTAPGAHATPVHTSVDASTEWVSFAEFEALHPVPRRAFYWPLELAAHYKKAAQESQARTYVRLNNDDIDSEETVRHSVSKSNSTRSKHAAYEVLFSSSNQDPARLSLEVAGYLSSGFPFVQDAHTSETDEYIGRTTATGWVVRTKSVHPLLDTEHHDVHDIDAYYLLSSVQGYTFRNRLVHTSRIAEEFES